MTLKQFRNSLKFVLNHHLGGWRGVCQHLLWQIKRRENVYPYEVAITPCSSLLVESGEEQNGCVSMCWSLGMYDYNNMSFLRDYCAFSEKAEVLDIGANIGVYSLVLSEVPGTQVESFEAHPETSRRLKKNIDHNKVENVRVHSVALSDKEKTIFFTDNPGSPMNRVCKKSNKSLEIYSVRGDIFLKKIGRKPNVAKIDVEGHELEVLLGLEETLKGIDVLVIEENIEFSTAQHLLGDLKGPFFIDYEERVISPEKKGTHEDPVFVSDKVLNNLNEIWGSFVSGKVKDLKNNF